MNTIEDIVIYQVENFKGKNGEAVTRLTTIDPNFEKPIKNIPPKLIGTCMVGHGMTFKFEFPESFSLKDCFEEFQETAVSALEQQQREQSILVPNNPNKGGIIVP